MDDGLDPEVAAELERLRVVALRAAEDAAGASEAAAWVAGQLRDLRLASDRRGVGIAAGLRERRPGPADDGWLTALRALEDAFTRLVADRSPEPPRRRAQALRNAVTIAGAWVAADTSAAHVRPVWVDLPSLHGTMVRAVAAEQVGAALVVRLVGEADEQLELHVTGDVRGALHGPELHLHGHVELRRAGRAAATHAFGGLRLVRHDR